VTHSPAATTIGADATRPPCGRARVGGPRSDNLVTDLSAVEQGKERRLPPEPSCRQRSPPTRSPVVPAGTSSPPTRPTRSREPAKSYTAPTRGPTANVVQGEGVDALPLEAGETDRA
jgi:hypothetical protein